MPENRLIVDTQRTVELPKTIKELKELEKALKANFEYAKEGSKQFVDFGKQLSAVRNEMSRLRESAVSDNSKMMKSYFQTGEALRTNLNKSLHETTQASNRAQQGFMAFAYILQDLPYGIRGVANNITQLSQVIGTPIWLNIAISGLTSLAVVFGDRLTRAIGDANLELDKFNSKSTQASRAFSSYGFGLEARAKYQIGGFSATKLTSEKGYYVTQADYVQSQIRMYEDLRDKILDKDKASEEEQQLLRRYERNITNLNAQLSAQLAYIQAINKEEEDRAKKSADRLAKQLRIYPIEGRGKVKPFYRPGGVGTPGMLPDVQETVRQLNKEELQEAVNTYNTVFFDPLRAGFKAIGDEIRTSLFGSLEDMKAKFGNIAAAILDSLSQVIAKLIETAIAASLLSFLFPGAGGFGTMFKNLIMPGQLITPTNNGVANSLATGGGGKQTVYVVVDGKISGNDIYLSNRRVQMANNAVKL